MINNFQMLLQWIIILTGWTGLAIVFFTTMTIGREETGQSIPGALVTYFSYFTILSNLLATLAITVSVVVPYTGVGRFFTSPGTISAIVIYIGLVGILYHLLLADLYKPQGIRKIANRITHVVMPVLLVLHWLIFVPKGTLAWADALVWMGFPIGYAFYILVRGAMTKVYPYPFLDVRERGLQAVLFNILKLISVFLVSCFLLIGLDKMIGRIL